MRPPVLYPLFAPITSLPGLGPRLGKLAERLTGPHVADILWHLPTGILDRANAPSIAEAPEGRIVTLTVRVDGHMPPVQRHRPYRVRCTDHTGEMELVFFHVKGDWLEKKLPQGAMVVVSGKVERFNGLLQMPHPDHFAPVEEGAPPQEVEAVYPLTGGLNPKPLRTAIQAALARAPDLEEWQDPAWLERQGWPTWKAALAGAHDPKGEKDVNPLSPLRQRLAYDELLANQLALALVRWHQRRLAGRATVGDGTLRTRIQAALPYQLTGAQAQALVEIDADMAQPERMLRLLQGDVGSGKTIVALMAMATAVEAGAQAALMAPTEILARQHAESLADLAETAGIRLALLTGRDKGKARQQVLDRLASGEIDILIGTHALFQEDVAFRDLALAIIDEQHKFGVHQRLALATKGRGVDTLVMTATPIPRTLTLTAYGDMDVSRLMEKPPGRKPVVTRAAAADRIEEVVERVAAAIKTGQRVYWVCPLVDESETVDLANATLRHATLMERLGGCVGLVHGKMKGAEKDAVMARFAAGELSVLVATTVIEVGVNVPEATIMVVEHAERFGLAQLHQLRGRVGRGERASACLLLYTAPLGETARARLDVMTSTEDGFIIAEKDLELRGAGEVLGTRQSGLPEFRMADITVHADLLATARDDASLMVARDPDLETPRGQALRVLLYLFQRDEAVKTLRSG
ncbi:ATP-dependent DNA helicase RecG [Nitrospirillum viridazoti]|uniref:ATP-dependent DNA helicase RecG n=1 Tax=Nitrospirillum viridazoti CBAmc TaxID=1441467 RepID=A0A248JQV7_9PROT|nr:ATP-dependent DNA helicase RecG [Nitrospirillum amazonense]ASG20468.1 ATP-dependent DNA helicase RecG [Nitrospirillum amazonense CBAmc]TWB34874.1 ATP-dependent DNA helicase RecG [Nitrospirillum amazonense]